MKWIENTVTNVVVIWIIGCIGFLVYEIASSGSELSTKAIICVGIAIYALILMIMFMFNLKTTY